MGRAPDDKGGATRLVSVKAVSDAYPLRGRLRVRDAPGAKDIDVAAAPRQGTVWVDNALLDSLGLAVGDPLLLGDASLTIARIIVIEPDRGAGFSSFAPRVMLNEADLAATGLVQPASRISYRLAVAADAARDAKVAEFVDWAEAEIKAKNLRGIRIESLATGRPEMRQTLDRAEKFLNLVALLSALLAAVAVGIASRDFAGRHLDDCAMLRVLGLPQRTIALQYFIEFALVGLLASVAGLVLGFVVHYVFVWLLAGLVEAVLPPPGVWPALFGAGVGFTLLFGFGLPPVLQLAHVPPLRVIRRDVGAMKPASLAVLGAGALGFSALLLAVSSDLKLGLIAVGGFAGAVCVFALLSWLALVLLRRSVPDARAPRWLILATRQLAARPAFAVLQVSALAVGLLALVLLALLRTDLVSSWREATPKDAPNRFVINVQPPQADAFQAKLRAAGVERYDWFPMIRGRLVAVDGKNIAPDDYADARARRLVDREFNLSHSASLPAHNAVVAGRWTPDEKDGLSVEEGLAETLGLKLGDRLRFDLGGTPIEGRITSLRKVDWSSMRVNFFVLFPTATMVDAPVSYIAAYRAPDVARLRQRDQPRLPEHHLDRRLGVDRAGPARPRPGRARRRVPVRLHARRRPRRPLRRRERDARVAGARVRGDARPRRERQAARSGAARRASRRRCARRPARVDRGDRRQLGVGALRLRVQLEPVAARSAVRRQRRRGARARRRLVGPARGADAAGRPDAEAGGGLSVVSRR